MTLEEFKREKEDLELAIMGMVDEFEKDTETEVKDIDFERIDTSTPGKRSSLLNRVFLTVEI